MSTVRYLDDRGFIKGFLIFVFLIGLAFVLIELGKPYYRYNSLQSRTKDILVSETPTDQTLPMIKTKILAEAEELKVPLADKDLSLTINSSKVVKVRGRWSETVNFWDYYQKKFDFEMDVEL